jgi:hypothetical protein
MNSATMHDGIVTNRDIVAYDGGVFLISAMYYCAVLNIDFVAYFYEMYVAPNYGIEPNTTGISKGNIPYNSCIFGYVTIIWYAR